ncbi:MAG: DUF4199 domain-containing protein [Chlorobi bacterium]|nr:DUF4199 domain-containing protein [Chlorobiota bacterium]
MNNVNFNQLLKYAFLMALPGLISTFVTPALDPQSTAAKLVSLTVMALMVLLLYYGILDYHQKNGIPFTFGNVLKTGMFIALLAGMIWGLGNYVYLEYLNPGYKEVLLQRQLEQAREQGLTEAQMELVRKGKDYYGIGSFAGSLLGALFIGVVTSVLTALWKRETPAA